MSGTDETSREALSPAVQAFLQRLYRDPRYLLIGKVERFGRQRIAFVEGCSLVSATGEVRGQALLNDEFELRGRPDGERPYDAESLLDHLRALSAGPEETVGQEELTALRDESWQYYVRRNFAFLLEDFEQARDDAEHNLGIANLIADSQLAEADKWSYLKWWPWIERDRAIAQALLDLEQGAAEHAATELYRAQRSIEQFGQRHAEEYGQEEGDTRSMCPHLQQHIGALVELLRKEERLPVSLEEQLDEATDRDDQEEVERLRSEMIRRAMGEGE